MRRSHWMMILLILGYALTFIGRHRGILALGNDDVQSLLVELGAGALIIDMLMCAAHALERSEVGVDRKVPVVIFLLAGLALARGVGVI